MYIVHILHIFDWFLTSAWVDDCQSSIVFERHEQAQVLYVIPVTSIPGRLPVVPVGEKGRTIPFDMQRESVDFIWILATYDVVVTNDVVGLSTRHRRSRIRCRMSDRMYNIVLAIFVLSDIQEVNL
jgi:hypothetical protein